MTRSFASRRAIHEHDMWDRFKLRRIPMAFDLEVTARCNLNCRHCYINLPAGDRAAESREMSLGEIERIGSEAAAMGAAWCLITGGEPLLRPDFFDLYLALKRQGLLLSVYTNATLITDEHIRFFRRYPPRDIEVTVYGATAETYETVTRKRGAFKAFRRGLDRLVDGGIKVRLKAMALRSNVKEIEAIGAFGRSRTKDFYRFDPFLHLRFDGDPVRNAEIRAERLSPTEIARLERSDPERFSALEKRCDELILPPESVANRCRHVFRCGAGKHNFVVGCDAVFRLCASLHHPACVYDLRTGTLEEAWNVFVPKVLEMTTDSRQYIENCGRCRLVNLCLWCPAHAHLETGELDRPVPEFCAVAHARAAALEAARGPDGLDRGEPGGSGVDKNAGSRLVSRRKP